MLPLAVDVGEPMVERQVAACPLTNFVGKVNELPDALDARIGDDALRSAGPAQVCAHASLLEMGYA
jgi:hypothetical protein